MSLAPPFFFEQARFVGPEEQVQEFPGFFFVALEDPAQVQDESVFPPRQPGQEPFFDIFDQGRIKMMDGQDSGRAFLFTERIGRRIDRSPDDHDFLRRVVPDDPDLDRLGLGILGVEADLRQAHQRRRTVVQGADHVTGLDPGFLRRRAFDQADDEGGRSRPA